MLSTQRYLCEEWRKTKFQVNALRKQTFKWVYSYIYLHALLFKSPWKIMSLLNSRHQNSSMKHLTQVTKIVNQYVLSSFDNFGRMLPWLSSSISLIATWCSCYFRNPCILTVTTEIMSNYLSWLDPSQCNELYRGLPTFCNIYSLANDISVTFLTGDLRFGWLSTN